MSTYGRRELAWATFMIGGLVVLAFFWATGLVAFALSWRHGGWTTLGAGSWLALLAQASLIYRWAERRLSRRAIDAYREGLR